MNTVSQLHKSLNVVTTGVTLTLPPPAGRNYTSMGVINYRCGAKPRNTLINLHTACKTHHGRAEDLWQSVRRTSFRRLAQPRVGTAEAGLITGIDHVAKRKQSHAEPDCRAVNSHHDGLRKCDQSIDEITAKHAI